MSHVIFKFIIQVILYVGFFSIKLFRALHFGGYAVGWLTNIPSELKRLEASLYYVCSLFVIFSSLNKFICLIHLELYTIL